jgi:hypothetical protein
MMQKIQYHGILFLLLASLLILSCAGSGKWKTSVNWEDLNINDTPGREEFPDEGAVILLDDGRMEIFSHKTNSFSEFERHKIIKILNYQGQRYANIAIPYSPGTTVYHIQARTISPRGKITVLDKQNIFDVNLYPNFIFYSDQRAKIFTLPAVEPGSIIEYRYRLSIKGRTLWHSWMFQDEIPTLHSRFTLIHPSEWDLNFHLYNMNLEPQVISAPQGFKSTHVWDARDIPAMNPEIAMPPRKEVLSYLSIAPVGINNWDDVAGWYDNLASPREKADPEIRKLAEKLTDGITENTQKLQKIYEWVRDNVRYIAVEIGIGGYQPHPAAEVLAHKYGDCKDMTTLLVSLAKAADIPVSTVLISTIQNGQADTTLPSPFHFNHAIAYYPATGDSGVWMDATEKGCPFGQLPWYDQGVPVLVVGSEEKGTIKVTPKSTVENNHSNIYWEVNLNEDGSARVKGTTRFRGAMASELRENFFYSAAEQIDQWLETYIAQRCTGAILDTFSITGMETVEDPLQVDYQFHTASFARGRSEDLVFEPAEMSPFEIPNFFTSKSRAYPIRLKFPLTQEISMRVQFPLQFKPETVLLRDSLLSPFGLVKYSVDMDMGSLVIRNVHQLSQPEIQPSDYSDFQNFLRRIQEKDQREVWLKRDKNYNGREVTQNVE